MKRSALLDKLSTGCLQAINDMSGLSLAIERYSDYQLEAFCCQMKMITILDFSGSIMGFCAVSFEEQMSANILGLGTLPSESERNELRLEYGGFFKEILNSSSGDWLTLLQKDYPVFNHFIAKNNLWNCCLSQNYLLHPRGRNRNRYF